MSLVSKKALEVPPFYVMEVLERAQELERQGRDIVHMEVGEPDFDSPPPVIAAGIAAIRAGDTHYTHSMGTTDLRHAIAEWHTRQYGVAVSPDRIVVTMGSSAALLIAFLALCDPGDEIVISDPHYACYPNMIAFAQGTPVRVPVREDDGFVLRADAVRAAIGPRTKAVLVNSPSNPTGNMMDAAALRELASLGVLVISDEIYHGLTYGERAHSMLEFSQECVVTSGFSKLFAMTGWRLGYVIAPPDLVRPMQKIQQNFFISAGSFVQAAGIAALRDCDAHTAAMREEYARRRELVMRRLREMSRPQRVEPTGAFYAFVNVRDVCARRGTNSHALAFDILERAGVAVTPGTDFGPGGEGYIRLSYANRYERLDEGLARLARYFAE